MYFAVPLCKGEIITDTPIDAKSIRSIFFVPRRTYSFDYSDNKINKVSIQIDGIDVVRDLFITPFLPFNGYDFDSDGHDSRRISLMCLKNVNMSEIRITSEFMENIDYDVVFEYSTTEVEQEIIEYVESVVFSTIDFENSYSINFTNEIQVHLKEDAEKIFAFSCYTDNGFFVPNYRDMNGYDSVATKNVMANVKLSVLTDNEIFPKELPTAMLTTTTKNAWKDVQYILPDKLSRNHSVKFTSDAEPSSEYVIILYYIHNNKLYE